MDLMSKIFASLLLVSLVFTLIGFLYKNNAKDVGGVDISKVEWSEYENKDLGFKLKYPKEFRPQVYNRGMAVVGNGEGVSFELITFERETNPNGVSLNDYINKSIICGEARLVRGECPTGENGEVIKVAGNNARKIVNPPAPIQSEMVIFEKDGFFYNFILDQANTAIRYSTKERSAIFDKFLESFEFLK